MLTKNCFVVNGMQTAYIKIKKNYSKSTQLLNSFFIKRFLRLSIRRHHREQGLDPG